MPATSDWLTILYKMDDMSKHLLDGHLLQMTDLTSVQQFTKWLMLLRKVKLSLDFM